MASSSLLIEYVVISYKLVLILLTELTKHLRDGEDIERHDASDI